MKLNIFALVNISNNGISNINFNPTYIHEFKSKKIKWKTESGFAYDSFEFFTNITKEIDPKLFIFAVKK
jgi:hypothetical protein